MYYLDHFSAAKAQKYEKSREKAALQSSKDQVPVDPIKVATERKNNAKKELTRVLAQLKPDFEVRVLKHVRWHAFCTFITKQEKQRRTSTLFQDLQSLTLAALVKCTEESLRRMVPLVKPRKLLLNKIKGNRLGLGSPLRCELLRLAHLRPHIHPLLQRIRQCTQKLPKPYSM